MKEITIEQQLTGTLMREGAGVKLHRYIGNDRKNRYDPILLFDFFDTEDALDYIGGFPSHPHRGFETVTYMIEGYMAHQDNHGHQGLIGPGDVQWMTAGRGIIHSEMPKQNEGRLSGIQMWLNLPAAKKGINPQYQEVSANKLPVEQQESGVIIKVIAGHTAKGTRSLINNIATEPLFLDIHLPAHQQLVQPVASDQQGLLFVLAGEVFIQGEAVKPGSMAVLSAGDQLTIQGQRDNTRCLLIAAKKIKEPIAWLGPFVMNTDEEVKQALEDYRNSRF